MLVRTPESPIFLQIGTIPRKVGVKRRAGQTVAPSSGGEESPGSTDQGAR